MHDTRTSPNATGRNVAMAYLRAFVTLLVIAHHAVLAYHPYAPPPPTTLTASPMAWQAFPVVDLHRWAGIDLFVGYNDTFFMALMFLVSGLFVWPSIQRKGPRSFIQDRLRRLGIPFVVAAGLLAPLAYLPAYLQTGVPSAAGFGHVWLSLGHWPAGPAWFLWVLLVFDTVAAGLARLAPHWGTRLGLWLSAVKRPAKVFWLLVAASAVAYVPLALVGDPGRWVSLGPFTFQLCRGLHYAVYFLFGVGLGGLGLASGLLSAGSSLARRWPMWILASLVGFAVAVACFIAAITQSPKAGWGVWAAVDVSFVLSCAASCFGFLALFVRFARPGRVGDSLAVNAYGMYILHYPIVSWLQYSLLRTEMSGAAKATLVFLGAVALSWALTALLRQLPMVGGLISSIPIKTPLAARPQ